MISHICLKNLNLTHDTWGECIQAFQRSLSVFLKRKIDGDEFVPSPHPSSTLKLRGKCYFAGWSHLSEKSERVGVFWPHCCAFVFFKYLAFSILDFWRHEQFSYLRGEATEVSLFWAACVDINGPCWASSPEGHAIQFSSTTWKPRRVSDVHFSLG